MILRVFFFLITFQVCSQSFQDIRLEFPFIEGKDRVESYISILESDDEVLVQGYLAVMYFFYSKESLNPFVKLKYFNKGKELLDDCIFRKSRSVELRYLRFGIQTQVPSFLGYNNRIESDFEYIVENIEEEDLSLRIKKKIIDDLILIPDLEPSKVEQLKQIKL